jgi:hypothetical protein
MGTTPTASIEAFELDIAAQCSRRYRGRRKTGLPQYNEADAFGFYISIPLGRWAR